MYQSLLKFFQYPSPLHHIVQINDKFHYEIFSNSQQKKNNLENLTITAFVNFNPPPSGSSFYPVVKSGIFNPVIQRSAQQKHVIPCPVVKSKMFLAQLHFSIMMPMVFFFYWIIFIKYQCSYHASEEHSIIYQKQFFSGQAKLFEFEEGW